MILHMQPVIKLKLPQKTTNTKGEQGMFFERGHLHIELTSCITAKTSQNARPRALNIGQVGGLDIEDIKSNTIHQVKQENFIDW